MTRDWAAHWASVPVADDPSLETALRQVGKTELGVPVPSDQIDLIIGAIRTGLQLGTADEVADLGCGNGVLTEQVAREVCSVVGLDVSHPLLASARRHRIGPNIEYQYGDLRHPSGLPVGTRSKFYAYEVFQHLDTDHVGALLQWLRDLGSHVRLFAGSIPDAERIRAFYNTADRWAHYERHLASGTEQIGTWWRVDELIELGRAAGFEVEVTAQTPALYTSHYRFDVTFA